MPGQDQHKGEDVSCGTDVRLMTLVETPPPQVLRFEAMKNKSQQTRLDGSPRSR